MSELFVDNEAMRLIKAALSEEENKTVRIFIAGGGCCSRLEITPAKRAITGDVVYHRDGIAFYIDQNIAASRIEITYDTKQGLIIDLNQ